MWCPNNPQEVSNQSFACSNWHDNLASSSPTINLKVLTAGDDGTVRLWDVNITTKNKFVRSELWAFNVQLKFAIYLLMWYMLFCVDICVFVRFFVCCLIVCLRRWWLIRVKVVKEALLLVKYSFSTRNIYASSLFTWLSLVYLFVLVSCGILSR